MGIFLPSLPGSTQDAAPTLSTAAVALAHAAALALLLTLVPAERLSDMAQPLMVRMVDLAPATPEAPPPKKLPIPPATIKLATPPPLLAVAAPTEAPAASFVIAAPPPPPAAASPAPSLPPSPAPATEAPLVAARFDADYLHNPKPFYPPASRRLGEQGKVVLRVYVGADGQAEKVELKTSSGFARLDTAAEDAVGRWRFVAARRGEQAVAAWVLVPIAFNLDS